MCVWSLRLIWEVRSIYLVYLDNLVVVYVVQSIGSISSSNHRRISQEVGAMDSILKIKLEEDVMLIILYPVADRGRERERE